MAKKQLSEITAPVADPKIVSGGYESRKIDEEGLGQAMDATMSGDECFKVVEVKFWGKEGYKATLIVKSKADLSRLECSEDECKEVKNAKPGQLLPVYECGARTPDQIQALPREIVPEAKARLIGSKNDEKKSQRRNDGVQQ